MEFQRIVPGPEPIRDTFFGNLDSLLERLQEYFKARTGEVGRKLKKILQSLETDVQAFSFI